MLFCSLIFQKQKFWSLKPDDTVENLKINENHAYKYLIFFQFTLQCTTDSQMHLLLCSSAPATYPMSMKYRWTME